MVSSAAVVALALAALLCCFLARRAPPAPRQYPDRDPEVQMRREVAGYYAPRPAVAAPQRARRPPGADAGDADDGAAREALRAALRGHWEPERREGRGKGWGGA